MYLMCISIIFINQFLCKIMIKYSIIEINLNKYFIKIIKNLKNLKNNVYKDNI